MLQMLHIHKLNILGHAKVISIISIICVFTQNKANQISKVLLT